MRKPSRPKAKQKPEKPALKAEVHLNKSVLKAWEDCLLKFARLPRGTDRKDFDRQQLLRAIIEAESDSVIAMWQVFNEDRSDLGRYLSDPKRQAVAYLLGFQLANLARNGLMWQRTLNRYPCLPDLWTTAESIIINDLGCGTGAASIACVDEILSTNDVRSKIQVKLVDIRGAFLDVASFQHQAAFGISDEQIDRIKIPVAEFGARGGSKDLEVFCIGYLWNEVMRDQRSRKHLIQLMLKSATRPSIVVISDSANQNISRDLMTLRNDLVAEGHFEVLYPCPHQHSCPMLAKGGDWCYSEGSWDMPVYQRRIDQLLEVRRDVFGGTLQILISRHAAAFIKGDPKAMPSSAKMIVGRPTVKSARKQKNPEAELLLCSESGLSKQALDHSLPRTRLFRGLSAP